MDQFKAKLIMLGFVPENIITTRFYFKDISIQAFHEDGIYIYCGRKHLCNHAKRRNIKDALNKIMELV